MTKTNRDSKEIIDLPKSQWHEVGITEALKRLREKNRVIFTYLAILIVFGLLMQPVIKYWLSLIPPPITLFKTEILPATEELKKLSLVPNWNYHKNHLIKVIGISQNKAIIRNYEVDREKLTAIDIISGQSVWEYQTLDYVVMEPDEEPILINGLLIFLDGVDTRIKLVVLDIVTGQVLWEWEPEKYQIWGFTVDKNKVYVSIRPYYLALNLYTGEKVWQSELRGSPGGLLLSSNSELVIIDPEMYVLDADTGAIKRSLDFKINSTAYRIYDGVIYWTDGGVKALDTKSNRVLWVSQRLSFLGSGRWSPMLRGDKLLYGIGGQLGALDKKTGEVVFGKPNADENEPFLNSNPVFRNGIIYALFSDGSLRMFDEINDNEISRTEFGAVFEDATLFATDKMLLVSPGGLNLYAFSFVK